MALRPHTFDAGGVTIGTQHHSGQVMLAKYARAAEIMRELPQHDQRSWQWWWNTHWIKGFPAFLWVGGIFTSFVLELVVYPAIYEIWKWHFEMKRARAEPQPSAPAPVPCS